MRQRTRDLIQHPHGDSAKQTSFVRRLHSQMTLKHGHVDHAHAAFLEAGFIDCSVVFPITQATAYSFAKVVGIADHVRWKPEHARQHRSNETPVRDVRGSESQAPGRRPGPNPQKLHLIASASPSPQGHVSDFRGFLRKALRRCGIPAFCRLSAGFGGQSRCRDVNNRARHKRDPGLRKVWR